MQSRLVKYVLWGLGGLIGLFALTLVAIAIFVDPAKYKPEIIQAVRTATGRELSIPGDIKLTVFPWLGLELGQIALGDAPGFGDEPFAAIDAATIRVKLLPILTGRIQADKASLSGLRLKLERAANGTANWDDLANKDKDKKDDSGKSGLKDFSIGGVKLADADISYTDRKSGMAWKVGGLTAETGSIAPGLPFDLTVKALVTREKPRLEAALDLAGRVTLNMDAQQYGVSGFALKVDAKGDDLPGKALSLNLGADAKADMSAGTASVDNLKLSVLGLTLTGRLAASNVSSGPEMTGRIDLAESDLRGLIKALKGVPLETADPQALSKVSAGLDLQATNSTVEIGNLKIRLDRTNITGNVAVRDFAKPAYAIGLNIDDLDADAYLPPKKPADPKATPTPVPAKSAEPDLKPLRDLSLQAELGIGKLKIAGVQLSEIKVKAEAKNGLLTLSPILAKLYGGQYSGELSLDARPETPVITNAKTLTGVQMEPLLKDVANKDIISGRLDLNSRLTMRGLDAESIKRSLTGKVGLRMSNGELKTFNISRMVRDSALRAFGKSSGKDDSSGTEFGEITATANITNGLARNEDLKLKAPLLRADGKGNIDIANSAMDYELTVTLVATLEGQGGAETSGLVGLPIPLYIKGPFSDLSYRLNEGAILKGLGRAVGNVVGKGAEGLKDVGGSVQKGIKSLFGN